MSTFFTDIQGALRVQLGSLSGLPDVAYENDDYTPNATTLFLRPTTLPIPTIQACLGDAGLDLHEGIFQVDVFVPSNSGRTTWPDTIADHFKRGTTLVQNTVRVTINSVSVLQGAKDDQFYIVPVEINYRAFTGAR